MASCNPKKEHKCPFVIYRLSWFSHFCAFLLVILLFNVGPVHSSEVLSGVPEPERAVMCVREKIHALAKPCSEDL